MPLFPMLANVLRKQPLLSHLRGSAGMAKNATELGQVARHYNRYMGM